MRQIQLFVLFILLIASIAFPLNFNDTPISASGQELTRAMSNWDMINYGQYGRSHSPQSIINQDNADNLRGEKGVRSMLWVFPSLNSSDNARPVPGAFKIPQQLWPVAT